MLNEEKAIEKVESITRQHVGTSECPIAGMPNGNEVLNQEDEAAKPQEAELQPV